MSLEKKAIARIVVYDPATRRNFWQGTVYRNGIQTPNQIVEKVKQVLGGLEEKKVIVKKQPKEDPDWLKEEMANMSKSIESDKEARK